MALKRLKGPAGTLVVLEHASKILKGNPFSDPHVRNVAVRRHGMLDAIRRASETGQRQKIVL